MYITQERGVIEVPEAPGAIPIKGPLTKCIIPCSTLVTKEGKVKCIFGLSQSSINSLVNQKVLFCSSDTIVSNVGISRLFAGCECDAGWALIDMIEKLKKKGIKIRTICAGSCSSMAAVILASGTKGERYAFPSSRIMIHQAGIELTGGKLDDIANTTKELQYWTDLTAKYISKVSGKKVKEVEKELCYDNYMTPSEAKKFGIIDKIDVVLA